MSIFAEFESALFFSLSLENSLSVQVNRSEIAENKKTSKDHFTSNQAASESKLLKKIMADHSTIILFPTLFLVLVSGLVDEERSK